MFQFFKKLKYIVTNYDRELLRVTRKVEQLEKVIADRTNIGVDVGFRDAHHVIVVGKYKGKDYIQTFDLREPELNMLVDKLRDMSKYGNVKRVDAPPIFKAVFEREKYNWDNFM